MIDAIYSTIKVLHIIYVEELCDPSYDAINLRKLTHTTIWSIIHPDKIYKNNFLFNVTNKS